MVKLLSLCHDRLELRLGWSRDDAPWSTLWRWGVGGQVPQGVHSKCHSCVNVCRCLFLGVARVPQCSRQLVLPRFLSWVHHVLLQRVCVGLVGGQERVAEVVRQRSGQDTVALPAQHVLRQYLVMLCVLRPVHRLRNQSDFNLASAFLEVAPHVSLGLLDLLLSQRSRLALLAIIQDALAVVPLPAFMPPERRLNFVCCFVPLELPPQQARAVPLVHRRNFSGANDLVAVASLPLLAIPRPSERQHQPPRGPVRFHQPPNLDPFFPKALYSHGGRHVSVTRLQQHLELHNRHFLAAFLESQPLPQVVAPCECLKRDNPPGLAVDEGQLLADPELHATEPTTEDTLDGAGAAHLRS
mmetsp:Transcript_2811/g.6868  ORF Transcript_2811/g.6868 Transcript_2811/m.6868 type:complete len:355 (+) Transcript_2811:796-1860(+)